MEPAVYPPIYRILKTVAFTVGLLLLIYLIKNRNLAEVASEDGLLTTISIVLLSSTGILCLVRAMGIKYYQWLFWLSAVGLIFMAFDDALRLHEGMDKAIHAGLDIDESPISDKLDALIVILYFIAGLIMLYCARGLIWQYPMSIAMFFIAGVFAVVMLTFDIMTIGWTFNVLGITMDTRFTEDAAKVISEYFVLLAVVETFSKEPQDIVGLHDSTTT